MANIAPGEAIEVTIRYVQHLTFDAGTYEFVFPMVVGPRFMPGAPTGKAGSGWSPDTTEVLKVRRSGSSSVVQIRVKIKHAV